MTDHGDVPRHLKDRREGDGLVRASYSYHSSTEISARLTISGNIAGLTNGTLSFIPGPSSSTQKVRETLVLNPIKCLAAPSTDATTFAMAGREVDVCIYDVERTFAEGRTQPDMVKERKTPKRGIGKVPEKLQDGEVWRAKNVSLATSPAISRETRC